MHYHTFREYVTRRDEGLLMPDKPAVPGMPKFNPFPATATRLKKTLTTVIQPPPPPVGTAVKTKKIPTIPSYLGITM